MNNKQKKQIPTEAITRSTAQMAEKTGNLYETVMIVGKRANQIARERHEEIRGKLEEFAMGAETLEEVYENSEQIELSRYYERLPKPTLVATEEYEQDELYFRLRNEEFKEGN